jgi:hypothetical protein
MLTGVRLQAFLLYAPLGAYWTMVLMAIFGFFANGIMLLLLALAATAAALSRSQPGGWVRSGKTEHRLVERASRARRPARRIDRIDHCRRLLRW